MIDDRLVLAAFLLLARFDKPFVSTLIPLTTRRAMVFDAAGKYLYITKRVMTLSPGSDYSFGAGTKKKKKPKPLPQRSPSTANK